MAPTRAEPALSELYGQTQARVVSLVTELDERQMEAPVPACPGWRVRDGVPTSPRGGGVSRAG